MKNKIQTLCAILLGLTFVSAAKATEAVPAKPAAPEA
jgi:hypothetical protein